MGKGVKAQNILNLLSLTYEEAQAVTLGRLPLVQSALLSIFNVCPHLNKITIITSK